MASSRNRALAIVALLARHPWGLQPEAIAGGLGVPLATIRRLIAGLVESSYVHGHDGEGRVRLRTKLPALALACLGASGVADVVQPILEDLARRTGELVRLAVVEDGGLVWAAKIQGARTGLLYEPGDDAEDFGPDTANGQVWLSCFDRARSDQDLRPDVARTLARGIDVVRSRGYAVVCKADEVGTSAIAAPIRRPGSGMPLGTVSVAGPTIRLSPDKITTFAPWLLACADELGAVAGSSPTFRRRKVEDPPPAGTSRPPGDASTSSTR